MGCVHSGCEGAFKIKNASDSFVTVSEQTSWSLSFSAQAKEYRPIGAYYPHRATSNRDWTLSLDGYMDIYDEGQRLIITGSCVDFELFPYGEGTNQPKITGSIYIESSDTSGAPDDLIPFSASGTGSSVLVSENFWIGDEINYSITPIPDVTGLDVDIDFVSISWDSALGATGYLLRYHDDLNTDWDTATPLLTIPTPNLSYISTFSLEDKTLLIRATDGCLESVNATTLFVQPVSPAELFLGSEKGDWYDHTNVDNVFQDASGTVPVTTAGDVMASSEGQQTGLLLFSPSTREGVYGPGFSHVGIAASNADFLQTILPSKANYSSGFTLYDVHDLGPDNTDIKTHFLIGLGNNVFSSTLMNQTTGGDITPKYRAGANGAVFALGANGKAHLMIRSKDGDPSIAEFYVNGVLKGTANAGAETQWDTVIIATNNANSDDAIVTRSYGTMFIDRRISDTEVADVMIPWGDSL